MNKAVLYMLMNEMATRITMVHMSPTYTEGGEDDSLFHSTIALLNLEYPKLVISAVEVLP